MSLGLVGIGVSLAIAWGALAIWFDGPGSRSLAGVAAGGFVGASLGLLLTPRPFRRGIVAFGFVFAVLLAWWLSIAPRNDRDWTPDVAVAPTAELQGNRLTIRGVRNFTYRSETEFTEAWEDRTFDLSGIQGLDLFLSYWGPQAIAHTIMSWEFSGGRHLAISIETRKERGESYSAVRGFFRQYELYHVVADERDLIGLRTNHRNEQVYLYRLRTPPDRARRLLLAYVASMNQLAREPGWYNALSQNCTTTIDLYIRHLSDQGPTLPWDWRLYANGYIDGLLYERGIINTSLPFQELKLRSDITQRAREAGDRPEFSQLIREGLPPRPPPPKDLR